MRIAFPIACFVTSALLAAPAFSAENSIRLLDVSGKVLVTKNEHFVPAKAGQVIADGSRILVADEATARVASADGACETLLPSGKVSVVQASTLCDAVEITPTAGGGGGGVPPPVVGLVFFAGALGVAAVSELTDNKPISAP